MIFPPKVLNKCFIFYNDGSVFTTTSLHDNHYEDIYNSKFLKVCICNKRHVGNEPKEITYDQWRGTMQNRLKSKCNKQDLKLFKKFPGIVLMTMVVTIWVNPIRFNIFCRYI